MATTKSPSKSAQNKSKLSALKNLVANVARGANAAKRAAAKSAGSKPAAPAAKNPIAKAAAAVASKPAPQRGAASAKESHRPATKTGRGRGGSGMPVTRLNVSVFAAQTQTAAVAGVAGESICREVACEALGTTGGYCRLHYIKNWRKIQRKVVILRERKLNIYIEELVAKYPDKYIEAIRQDLVDDRAFAKVIADLDLDESVDDFEGDGENVEAVIDTIKRDFDEDPEVF